MRNPKAKQKPEKSLEYMEYFYQSIAKVIFSAQIFAVLPVSNVLQKDLQRLQFRWLSLQSIYASIIFTLNILEFIALIRVIWRDGINFHNSGYLSLYVVCLLEHIYFYRLAIKWPFLMKAWHKAEHIFQRTPYKMYANYSLSRRLNLLMFLVMFAAFLEHSLLVSNSIYKGQLELRRCKFNISFAEHIYRRERYYLYSVLPYRVWLLPLLEWTNLTMAFPRSFTDVFITCVCLALARRFHQLYKRIEAVHSKAVSPMLWCELRQHFLVLKKLMHLVNVQIAPLILLASGNNMYFICFQLFNSFQNTRIDLFSAISFWYSLLFAIVRTIITFYIASLISTNARHLLATLRNVPSRFYCTEVQRFSEQLAVDLTAMSGAGFFLMTRRLILGMASTIVTYELMVVSIINKGGSQQLTFECPANDNSDKNQ